MLQVSEKEHQALTAICDAILPAIHDKGTPSIYWTTKASDLNIPDKIIDIISSLSQQEQKEFKLLLKLLATPLLGLTWWGSWKPAHKLSEAQRTRLLQKWSNHSIKDIRKGFSTLKKLTTFFFYGGTVGITENPSWEAIQYQFLKEKSPDNAATKIEPLKIDKDTTLDCDVVIIGSGAGGCVVAAKLAAKGKNVIIVEKGPYLSNDKLTRKEEEMFDSLYEARGAMQESDGHLGVLAGSCLGGGTIVNWAGAFRTPDYILEEWAKEHDNPHFLSNSYQEGFDIIEKALHVNKEIDRHNPQNQALFDGAKKLNYNVKIIPRNVKKNPQLSDEMNWKVQGFSPHGESFDTKQTSLKAFLEPAHAKGARILVNTEVDRIAIQNATAQGVQAHYTSSDGKRYSVHIKAQKVVLSAGSIHSPVILQKSGLRHPEIGRNLYLHPTTAAIGLYPHRMENWYGPMMSAVCDEFTHLDGNYGAKLETPPGHPGLISTALPWKDGRDFKEEMKNAINTGSFIVLTRDKFGGSVKANKQGRPKVDYSMSEYDKKHMIRVLQEAIRIHIAAGAERVGYFHNQADFFYPSKGNLEAYLAKIATKKWTTARFFLASAHQMGTCRMGGSDKLHPVKPNGETREVKNLFVADASLFPSASGANPMLSVQTLAYYVAAGIA